MKNVHQRLLSLCLMLAALFGALLVADMVEAGPAEIRQIQQKLTELGYDPGPVDGAWGGKTETASRAFLQETGRRVDPVFDGRNRNEAALLDFLSSGTSEEAGEPDGAASRAVLTPQIGHTPNAIAVSPDGQLLVSGDDQNLKLWKVSTGQLLRTISAHSRSIEGIAFAPNGKHLVSVSRDATVKLWDASAGRLVRTMRGHSSAVWSADISADGAQIATGGSDRILNIWELATGRRLRRIELSAPITSVRFLPDTDVVVVALDGNSPQLAQLDIRTGRRLRTLRGHSARIWSIAVSAEEGTIASAGEDKSIVLWDIATGRRIRKLEGHSGAVFSIAFSPDGKRLVSGSLDGSASVWDMTNGKRVHRNNHHKSSIYAVAFLPTGEQIAAAGKNFIKLWQVMTGQPVRIFESVSRPVWTVAISPDGNTLASGGDDGAINYWDVATGKLEKRSLGHLGKVSSVDFSTDGTTLVSGSDDKNIRLWDAHTGEEIRTFRGHSKRVNSVALAPDGKTIVSGSEDGTIRLWNAATGQTLRTIRDDVRKGDVTSVAYSPDGTHFAAGINHDLIIGGTLKIWHTLTGRLRRTIDRLPQKTGKPWLMAISFSPDGRHVLGAGMELRGNAASPSMLRLWNVKNRSLVRSFQTGPGMATSAVFSADGSQVASTDLDGRITLWEPQSGRPVRHLTGHKDAARDTILSPDGRRLYSASFDTTVKIWDVESGTLLATLIGGKDGEWLTVTPEGFFASSKAGAQILSVVRGVESYSIDQFYQALYRPDLVREKLAGDPDGKVREATTKLNLDKIIDSGGAPSVAITSPADGRPVTDDRLSVSAKIADAGGGIGRIEWRVNGLTLGVRTMRGFERVAEEAANPDAKSITISQDVWLDPGRNTIEVVAYNGKNLIASEPAKINVTWDGQSSKTPPRLHVLAVGVNDYFDSRLKLNFAVPDAKAFGAALSKAGSGLYEAVSVTSVLDGDTTEKGLEAAFADLAKKVRPRDVFVFFLAGHGKTVDGRYYFIPQDFRYRNAQSIIDKGIGQDRWQRWLSGIPARKSILLYDTCESGSLTGQRIATRGMERVAALEKLTRAMGRTVLSAATDDAPALEGYKGHGVFTHALLQALAHSDANKNALIEVTELAGYVDAQVPEISHKAFGIRQIPQMNIVGSNFPLVKQTTAVASTEIERAASSIPTKPTHVVLQSTDLFAEPGGAGTVVRQLKPGTTLTMVQTEHGWMLVAKDGKKLGYVAAQALIPMQ